jgi:hypothetical protein
VSDINAAIYFACNGLEPFSGEPGTKSSVENVLRYWAFAIFGLEEVTINIGNNGIIDVEIAMVPSAEQRAEWDKEIYSGIPLFCRVNLLVTPERELIHDWVGYDS